MLQRYKGQNLYNQSVKSYSEAMSEMGTYLLRDPPPKMLSRNSNYQC